jgi:integrase
MTSSLTPSPAEVYNPFKTQSGGMAMNGSIRCVRCNSGIDEDGDGVCPRCKKVRAYYIRIYWDGKHYPLRLRLDWDDTRKKLRKIRSEIDENTFDPLAYLPADRNPNILSMRLAEWLSDVEDSYFKGTMAKATCELYRYTSHRQIGPSFIADKDVTAIDSDDLELFFRDLAMRGTTRRTVRSVLHVFFVWLKRHKYLSSLPMFPTVRKQGAKQKYVLTWQQQEQAFEKIPDVYRDIYRLMSVVGARVSEILTLKIADINLERRVVTIQRTWSRGTVKDAPKTDTPRTLPLSDMAVEIIRRNLKDRVGDAYLFCKRNGQPYSYSTALRVWRTYSGFKIPPKDGTRRSWATAMRNAGVPLEAIQKGLGHASVATTELYLDGDVSWAADVFSAAEKKIRKVLPLTERLPEYMPKK